MIPLQRSMLLGSRLASCCAATTQTTAISGVLHMLTALHAAWKPSCELLRCDHTNYRDLWRAPHAHSSSLLDMGASARHMQVHIQTRKTLELRMQQFLAEHAKDEATARKIHKHEATEWSGAPKQYFSQTRGAYAEFMVDRAFSLPVSTRVYPLRLFDGEKLE